MTKESNNCDVVPVFTAKPKALARVETRIRAAASSRSEDQPSPEARR